jgi:hypothetical protein
VARTLFRQETIHPLKLDRKMRPGGEATRGVPHGDPLVDGWTDQGAVSVLVVKGKEGVQSEK